MRMNRDVRFQMFELPRTRFVREQIIHKFFEEEAPLRDVLRILDL